MSHFGSEEAAFKAIVDATQGAVQKSGIQGLFEIAVDVAGKSVTVRGAVVNGLARIGTAFIP